MAEPVDDLTPGDEDRFGALADAVADGGNVDWASAESSATSADERDLIQQLRTLADVVRFHQHSSPDPAATPSTEPVPGPSVGSDSSPLDADIPPGDGLRSWGRLIVRAEIGRGSFATVFRAWDPRLKREVALKLLHEVESSSEDRASTVINEGRLLAKIDHPNVVTVFDADAVDGAVGLWMEFVKGRTLREIQEERGPYSSEEAVVIGLDLCRALAAVHHAGILHRDVKAQNVMREAGGRTVLMDFGAAGIANVGSGAATKLRGTPAYLAPEVLDGDAPSVQSDIYSLGVLLYYLVSGEFPVTGHSLDELRQAHAQGRRRSLRDVRPGLLPSFVRLVDEATAVQRHHRPETAGAMEALLESVAGRRVVPSKAAAVPGFERDRRQSIAVLPFADMSPERNLEYFCDGIVEEIINALTIVPGLRVVARSSAFQFKKRTEDLRQVGSMLNVGTVLEGSVRASGDRLRVTSRLINTANGYQLWSERFDRSLDDVFAVQDEIARAAVRALGVGATQGESGAASVGHTPTTHDLDAYTSYLKARHYWNNRTESGLRKSVAYFQAAIDKDAEFAEAHAGLAEAQATLGLYGLVSPHEAMPRAREAATRASSIAGTLSSPFATLGCVATVYDWAWLEAERHYNRAIELNPQHPAAHHWYGINYLVPLKRFHEADAELRRAVEADPFSMPIRVSLGLRRYFAHEYAKALDELRDALELDPGSAIARLFVSLTLVEMEAFDEAVGELETAMRLSSSPEMTAALGYVCGRAGYIDRAVQALDQLAALASDRYVSASLLAQVHAGLGDKLAALDWLEKAMDTRAADLAWLAVRPVFDSLRGETRFNTLVARLNQ